ncbi:hypothetical protein HPB50_004475 [Hyalomma asiaticum]|uniref:Uncharacterized protein n=1 Tax=Hyalomma asiaticum TaxID=266040 RepID=A0ACB7RKA0_HYAAI|nr:hypothetical protein HPB50_004475 [Hyalomma asiaticum]
MAPIGTISLTDFLSTFLFAIVIIFIVTSTDDVVQRVIVGTVATLLVAFRRVFFPEVSRGTPAPHQEDSPVLWRVEQGLTLRLWRDSSHVSPRLLALRYRDAPGGQDARDLVPLGDGDAENEADGADDVRNCFYSGEVVGEPGSKAVVSLCHGMIGRTTTENVVFVCIFLDLEGTPKAYSSFKVAHVTLLSRKSSRGTSVWCVRLSVTIIGPSYPLHARTTMTSTCFLVSLAVPPFFEWY